MDDKKITGVLLREDDTFYYYESGPLIVSDPISKVLATLSQRGKRLYQIGQRVEFGNDPYTLITLAEAKKEDKKIEIIYASANIRKAIENKTEDPESQGW